MNSRGYQSKHHHMQNNLNKSRSKIDLKSGSKVCTKKSKIMECVANKKWGISISHSCFSSINLSHDSYCVDRMTNISKLRAIKTKLAFWENECQLNSVNSKNLQKAKKQYQKVKKQLGIRTKEDEDIFWKRVNALDQRSNTHQKEELNYFYFNSYQKDEWSYVYNEDTVHEFGPEILDNPEEVHVQRVFVESPIVDFFV